MVQKYIDVTKLGIYGTAWKACKYEKCWMEKYYAVVNISIIRPSQVCERIMADKGGARI